MILLVSTAAIPGSAIHQSLGVLVAMYVAGIASALVLALVATGFGCLAGALGTGGDDAVSLGDLLSVVFVVAGVLAFSAPTIDALGALRRARCSARCCSCATSSPGATTCSPSRSP